MYEPRSHPWLPYVAPLVTFLALTSVEGWFGAGAYPMVYAAKVAIVAAVAWACRSSWRDLAPWPGWGTIGIAVALGLGIAAVWVGLDPYYPRLRFLGTRSAFDPSGMPAAGRTGFLAVRLFGLVVLVPLIEELFWRSFVMRWMADPDFEKVPVGRVTPAAAAVTSALFAAEHPEWLPALITGLAWAGLLARTRSLAACVASHAAANLGLGAYVLATGAWKFL
jgi:uncharacterized protein